MTADDAPPGLAPRPSRLRALLGGLVIAAVVAGATIAIYHQRHSFASALHKVGVLVMIAGFLAGMAGVAATLPIWRTVLDGLNVHLPWGAAARVFFTSQLGKYLPGSVWPVLIQMEAGRARGAARRTMLAANVITIVLSCTVGLCAAAVLLPLSDATALRRYWWLLLALPFLLALLHPRAIPALLDRLFGLLRRPPMGERLPLRSSLVASMWSLVSFAALGGHVAIIAVAIGGGGAKTVVLSIGGMAPALSAGVLFIPAPVGAGVRDVILTLVLRGTLTSGQALAAVVASRALLIAADLVLAGLASAARARRPSEPALRPN